MAEIVKFTNNRRNSILMKRDFINYIIEEITKILNEVDNVSDQKELIKLMDKLHKYTESLHAMGFEYEASFGFVKKRL